MAANENSLGVDSVIGIPSAAAEYRLLTKRGWGGFADVWEAEAPGGFRVALRLVRSSPERQAAELRAITVIRRIRHPHLLPIFGAWQEQGMLIIGMELAERSLWDRFVEARKDGLKGIPRRELLHYLADAAAGIDFLNSPRHTVGEHRDVGIQHRDVKPRNILLFGSCAKLGDFGLVRELHSGRTGHPGSWTLGYAAPEYFSSQLSPQSDQYALAVTYCQMRGGVLPFRGSVAEVMAGHMLRAPELDSLPEAERPIVGRALAKEPGERWPDCRSFIDALTALAWANGPDDQDRLPADEGSDIEDAGAFSSGGTEGSDVLSSPAASGSDLLAGLSDLDFGSGESSTPDVPSHPSIVSDFLVSASSEGSALGAYSSASEFQVLSQWSGEASSERDRTQSLYALPSMPSISMTQPHWSALLIPGALLLFMVGFAMLSLWPHARSEAWSGQAAPAIARRPGAVEKTKRFVANGPQNPTAPTHATVANPSPPKGKDERVALVKTSRTWIPSDPDATKAATSATPIAKNENENAKPDGVGRIREPQPAGKSTNPHEAPHAVRKPAQESVAMVKRPQLVPARRPPENLAALSHDAYRRGQADLAKRSYIDAIGAFNEALEHDRRNLDARFSRAVAEHSSGAYQDAVADYDAYIKRRRDDPVAYLLRGRAHRALGALDRAEADLDEAIRLRPDDPAAFVERGYVHHRAGHYDQALADYSTVIRLRPDDPSPRYHRGMVHYQSGALQDAIEDFDRAIELDPNRADAYLARSEAYARLGRHTLAAADHDAFDSLIAKLPPLAPLDDYRTMANPESDHQ